ncbi:MAG TPA: SRPBCC family protein, partial [Candidatus Limnocylindria bacterium]|nr:SRPBCC family protein [Candidatus Limnocylindria bacterium]
FVADLANLPRWQTGIVSAELTSPLPVGIGSTAHVVRELMGQRIAVDLRVTAYEPGRRLGLSSAASGIGIDAVLELEPTTSGTLARFSMDIKAQNVFMKPMEGMVAGAASSDLATSLDRLRTALQDA